MARALGRRVVDQALDGVDARHALLVQCDHPRRIARIDLCEQLVGEPEVLRLLGEHAVGHRAIRRRARRTDLVQERHEPRGRRRELGAYRGVSCDLVPAFERFLVRDGEPRPIEQRAAA